MPSLIKDRIVRLACRVSGCHTAEHDEQGSENQPAGDQSAGTPTPSPPARPQPRRSEPTPSRPPDGIVTDGLGKTYAGGVVGAADISISVAPGEIVAVVGPNGSGKSTTLNMISGLVEPSAGSALVAGIPITQPRLLGRALGVALQSSGLDPLMTGAEHFELQAALYDVDPDEARQRRDALLESFNLTPVSSREVGKYSGGMQRRLSLALALVHHPTALVFDEPTAGLDPQARRSMWSLLQGLRDEGRAILFSTQILEEADIFAQRIYVLAGGRVLASGTPNELRGAVGDVSLRIRVGATASAEAEAVLRDRVPDLGVARVDADVLVYVGPEMIRRHLQRTVDALHGAGLDLLELNAGRPSLEDAYVHFTGQASPIEPLVSPQTGRGTCRCQ